MGVIHPISKDHAKAWEPKGRTKVWGSFTGFQGPRQSVGVHHPNLRGHTKVWESITPTLRSG